MSYEKQTFEDGQVLKAEDLNHIETELAREKSWNELADKPVVVEGGDTLTWDGNTEGLVSYDFGGSMEAVYKVSDAIPSANDFVNGITLVTGGEAETFDEAIMQEELGILFGVDYLFMVVPAGVEGLEAGLYMRPVISSLTIPGYTGFGQEKIAPSHLYQPDWNQTDETAADFIKNKPFGDTVVEIMPETEVTGAYESDGVYVVEYESSVLTGDEKTLFITFDGVDFTVVRRFGDYFGNLKFMGMDDTGEPFLFMGNSEFMVLFVEDAESHTVAIQREDTKQLAAKYVPQSAKFYVNYNAKNNGDVYIYTDSLLTQKATGAEWCALASNQNVQIIAAGSGISVLALCPVAIPLVEKDEGYVSVVVYDWENNDGSFRTFYTAEYTGS